MPIPAIIRGEEYFFTTIYSGNGQGQRVGTFLPYTDNGTIDKSCMFDSSSNVSLTRTPSSAGNRKTFTVSVWAKRSLLGDAVGNNTYGQRIFNAGSSGSSFFDIKWSGSGDTEGANRLHIREYSSSAEQIEYWTNRTFEDTSKWYHILLQVDTTQSNSTDRIKLYIDGDQVTSWYRSNAPSQDFDTLVNSTVLHNVGRFTGATSNNLDGYLAEFNLVDGSIVAPTTFGLTDTSTGRWIPKTLSGITYGTNGFRMKFQDSSSLGDDTSGNTNDYASSNLTTSDQRSDTPTNNLPTMRPYNPSYVTTQRKGNLQYTPTGTNAGYPMCSTLRPNSGKWYAEARISSNGGGNVITFGIYIQEDMHYWDNTYNFYPGGQLSNGDGCGVGMQIRNDGNRWLTSSTLSSSVQTNLTGTALAAGDVIGIAVDVDNSLVTWYSNSGSSLGSASILRPGRIMFTAMAVTSSDTFNWNFGDNPTFDGNETAGGNSDGDGNGNFYHSVPSGFKMLRQDNMAETNKDQPDWVWIKNRDASDAHQIYDSNRGPQKDLNISTTQESTTTDGLQKFLKGGFAIEDDVSINTADEKYVSWNWVCNGGTTSTNDTGSIDSTVQVNSTAGFSIIQHTGNGTNGATIGHGLSQAPTFLITKNTNTNNRDWMVWHHKLTDGSYFVDLNNAEQQIQSTSYTNSTAPSSTVITLGTSAIINGNGESYVTYAFHEVEGFSKFGSYKGNANSNGPFIYTGFKPSWLLLRNRQRATSWYLYDNKRTPFNQMDGVLYPDLTNTESTGSEQIDFLSNGFKLRSNNSGSNRSGEVFIYIAFAEHPFIGDGTNPVTAK